MSEAFCEQAVDVLVVAAYELNGIIRRQMKYNDIPAESIECAHDEAVAALRNAGRIADAAELMRLKLEVMP